ncbi:MAG: Protease IV [Marinimicrobia bacterium 46_43]|nr:MAG: Protease IV [Marinimicrobia bacterium 46_43]HBY17688.1 signal peptide peptidase SppA [Candidatus Neomarinimicrobiota bacterium]
MKRLIICILMIPALVWAQFPRLNNPAMGESFLQYRGVNPAVSGLSRGSELHLFFQQAPGNDYYGGAGLSLERFSIAGRYDSSLTWNYGFGIPLFRHVWFGADYSTADESLSAGLLFRPFPYLSLGAVLHNMAEPDHLTAGLAVRPFNNRLTFGYSYLTSVDEHFRFRDHHAVYTANMEVRDGLLVGLSYDDYLKTAQVSMGITFTHQSLTFWKDKERTTLSAAFHTRYLRKITNATPVVYLRLKGTYVREMVPGMVNTTDMNDLLAALRAFQKDASVECLFMDIRSFSMGLSELMELQHTLVDLRDSGKRIYAYSTNGNLATWYLSAAAEKQMAYPLGEYRIQGLSSSSLYMREMLDSLGIAVEIQRIGKYKSGPEPLLMTGMSESGKEALKEYLSNIMDEIITGIARGSRQSYETVDSLIRNGPYLAQEARDLNLIQKLAYPDEIKELIAGYEDVKMIEYKSLWAYSPTRSWPYDWEPDRTFSPVAVIYASGTILEGRSRYSPFTGELTMGDQTILDRLKTARKDPRVKAIVFRVDSPGGSILASDKIHQEISRIMNPSDKKKAKPFIVSMGTLAASGGYYISASADKIFAEPNTLTGSIGIYGGSLTFEKFLREKLRIHPDSLQFYPNSQFGNPLFSMSDAERNWQFKTLKSGYDRFVNLVSDGRNMSYDQVDSVGQGRIWTGQDAISLGLVDTLGTLTDAIHYAASLAHVNPRYTNTDPYPGKGYGMQNISLGDKILVKTLGKYPALQKAGAEVEWELLWKENDMMIILPWRAPRIEF